MRQSRIAVINAPAGGSFAIPTFDGSHAVFGDEKQGYIECYSSGTLTFPKKGIVDIFAVAGGSGGNGGSTSGSQDSAGDWTFSATGGQGGRAGAYITWAAQEISAGVYSVSIGAANGASSLGSYSVSGYSGTGGATNTVKTAGFDDMKVSKGKAGSAGVYPFSDSNFKKICGAGGSGAAISGGDTSASGGTATDGGGTGGKAQATGGTGTYYTTAGTAGTANTGGGGGGGGAIRYINIVNRKSGGGAGGSGIVIIRWGYAA